MAVVNEIYRERSAYQYYISESLLSYVDFKLYAYTGSANVNKPSTPTYELRGKASKGEVSVDLVSPLVDSIPQTFDGTYSTEVTWVDWEYTASYSDNSTSSYASPVRDGISATPMTKGYWTYGNEYDIVSSSILLNTDTLYIPEGEVSAVAFYQNISSSEDIQLASTPTVGDFTTQQQLSSDDVIRYESVGSNVGFISSSQGRVITVKEIEGCQFKTKVTFLNRYGVLQDIYFTGNIKESLSRDLEKHISPISSNGTYSTTRPGKDIFVNQVFSEFEINSGFYPESYNEVFEELLLSQQVWITKDGEVIPVNIVDSTFALQTSLKNKAINYTITVSKAAQEINKI